MKETALLRISIALVFLLVLTINYQRSSNLVKAALGTLYETNESDQGVLEGLDSLPAHSGTEASSISQRRRIPITELTNSDDLFECPEGQVFVPDTVLDPSAAWTDGRKIPRIIHVTGRSRCLAPEFAAVLDEWRLEGYSFFYHDDDALARLLETARESWKEFPALSALLRCVKYGGAMKADIWRLLVMWE